MEKIDNIGLKLCDYQADLFEKSLDKFNCGSEYFIKIFMNSNLAFRIDNDSFLLESLDTSAALLELINQYSMNVGKIKYPSYVIKWIGYIYRYYSYTYKLSSKKVYKIIKPKELYSLYEAYHSLDPKEALERILETKNVSDEVQLVELAKKFFL